MGMLPCPTPRDSGALHHVTHPCCNKMGLRGFSVDAGDAALVETMGFPVLPQTLPVEAAI